MNRIINSIKRMNERTEQEHENRKKTRCDNFTVKELSIGRFFHDFRTSSAHGITADAAIRTITTTNKFTAIQFEF